MNTDSNTPVVDGDMLNGALLQYEDRYQKLFMTNDHAAFICDAACGDILDANPAAERLYGYTRRQLLEMKISALAASGGSACVHAEADARAAGGTHPLRYHKKSTGATFPVEAWSGSFEWRNRPCRFEIHRDLAGRRSLESELRSSEARMKLFLDAMHDGLAEWDLATEEMFYSPGWLAMLGYSRNEVPPYSFFWRSIVHPDDDARLRRAIDEHLKGSTPRLVIELRMRAKNRSWKWIECRGGIAEWDETGAPRKFIASFADIEERKASESEFRSIVLSEVYEKLFIKLRVFRHGESMAMNLNRLLLFAQNITDLHASFRKSHESGTAAQPVPVAQRVNVAVNEFNLLVYPELRSIGLLLQAIGEENLALEGAPSPHASGRELLKLNENVNRLVGQMKDVLTNPQPAPAAADVKELRTNMLRHVDSLKHLVGGLMKLVESELTCDVGTTVETVAAKYSMNIFGIPVELKGLSVPRCVVGKPGEVGEILSILIHNALEALDADPAQAREEKRILVKCTEHAGRVTIAIEDTGPGVSEELREKIFDDGFTTKSNGHGFGLSYARSTLKKFGGRIVCEPNAPRGARFLIELIVLN